MLRTRILMLVVAALLTGGLLGACSSEDAGGGSAGTTSGAADHDHGGAHDHSHASPVAPGARQVPVNVWAFGFEPREIAGSVGEDLDIVLTSQDVLHDFGRRPRGPRELRARPRRPRRRAPGRAGPLPVLLLRAGPPGGRNGRRHRHPVAEPPAHSRHTLRHRNRAT